MAGYALTFIMTNRNPITRPAMTAIAAAIACSTPSFAQSADPPVAETPAPVVAAPVVAEPVAETPIVPDTPVVAEPLAPAEAVAKPAARKATATRAPAARSRPAPARVATVATAVAAPAPAPAAAAVAPVADAPAVEPLPVQPEAAPVVAPAEPDASSMDAMMPALAAGGLAIVVLAGVGLALRRRKRRAAETEEAEQRTAALDDADAERAMSVEPEPAIMVEPGPQADPVKPAFVAAPALATKAGPVVAAASLATKAAPVVAAGPAADPTPDVDGPVTELPEDFDLSRFGYNVQEAYKGPTEDNPSLSLKNRLSRARGMDQLERNLDAEVEAATGEPVLTEAELNPPAESAAEPATAPQAESEFMLTKPGTKPALRPAYPK